jgi:alpha-L-fucosidase
MKSFDRNLFRKLMWMFALFPNVVTVGVCGSPKTGNDLESLDVGSTALKANLFETAKAANLKWWRDARFGCFVHWGVYSQLGNEWREQKGGGYAEHIQRVLKISMADYKTDAIDQFNPTKFDADAWISLIQKTGMRYFIITAKHHDGFAMYDSKVSDYTIVKQGPWRHDPMKDLKVACDKRGVAFGFYYSHAFDWGDRFAPGNDWEWRNPGGDLQLGGSNWYDTDPERLQIVRNSYVDKKSIPQIKELIADYQPKIFWFDTPSKLPPAENARIMAAVREAGPDLVVNGRLVSGAGDYLSTGDRAVEFRSLLTDWEAIPTTNESYGWNPLDFNYKTPEFLIRVLAKAVSRGGNLLLNIGPTRDGSIDPHDVAILDGIGRWMAVNGEAIHGAGAAPLPPQPWGVVTAKGKTLYAHIFDWSSQSLVVGGLQSTPSRAYLLKPEGTVPISFHRLNDLDLAVALPVTPVSPAASVVVLEFDDIPRGTGVRLLNDDVKTNQLLAFDAKIHDNSELGDGVVKLGYGDGKLNNYCVNNWVRNDQWISWEVRINQAASFDVSLHYGIGKGGDYEVRCGNWSSAQVAPGVEGKVPWIATPRTDSLGRLTLPAGIQTIELRVTRVNDGEVFRPFDLFLTPEKFSNHKQ